MPAPVERKADKKEKEEARKEAEEMIKNAKEDDAKKAASPAHPASDKAPVPAKASTEEKAKEAKPVAAKVPAGFGWSKKEAKLEKGSELSKKKPK